MLFGEVEEDEEEAVINDGSVEVKGELNAGPLSRLKKLSKANVVEMKPDAPKRAPAPLPRTPNWQYPSVTLLNSIKEKPESGDIAKRMQLIKKTMQDFGIDICRAPAFL